MAKFFDDPQEPPLEELDQTPQGPQAPPDDPYLAIVRSLDEAREARVRASVQAATETTPERAAEVRQLSDLYRVTPDVAARNFDELKRRAAADAVPVGEIRAETPKLAEWLEKPENAALARDDIPQLRGLAKGLLAPSTLDDFPVFNGARSIAAGLVEGFASLARTGEWAGRVWGGALANGIQPGPLGQMQAGGFGMGGSTVKRQAQKPTDPDVVFLKTMREELTKAATGVEPDLDGAAWLERGIHSGLRSVGTMLPAMGAAVATGGGSAVVLPILGAQTFGASYGRAIDAGLSFDRATLFGGIDAIVEVATELLPAKYLFGDIAKNAGIATFLKHQILSEGFGESIATTVQGLNEFVTFRPTEPITTFLEELPGQIAETLVATITMVGVMSAAGKVAASVSGPQGNAKLAERDRDWLATLRSNVLASQLVQRSPAEAQALIQELNPDSTIYLPVAAFEAWAETAVLDSPKGKITGADAIAGELTGQADALERARQSGVDLEVPLAAYAVQLAGTDHHAFFAEEVRVNDPNRMNGRELAALRAAELAKVDQVEPEAALEPSPARQATLTKIEAAMTDTGLDIPAGATDAYADIFEAFTATFEGEQLDPVETLQRYGILVLGPKGEVAAAERAGAEPAAERAGAEVAPAVAEAQAVEPQAAPAAAPALSSTAPEAPGATTPEEAAALARDAAAAASKTPEGRAALSAQVAADDAARDARMGTDAFRRPAYTDPEAVEGGRALQARLAANKAPEVEAPPRDALEQAGRRRITGAEMRAALAPLVTPPPGQRTLFQGEIEAVESVAPRFYSRLLRAVAFTPMQSAPGFKWKGVIKKWAKQKPTPTLGASWTEGINQMELALTSIDDLDDGTVYSKQDVLNYLGTHEASVSEFIFGDPIQPGSRAIARNESEKQEWIQERAQEIYDEEAQSDRDNAWENFNSELRYEAESDTDTVDDPDNPDEEIEVTTWRIVAYRGRRSRSEEVERADEVFDTEEDAEEWLETREGQRWKEPIEEQERDDFLENYEGEASWGDAENAAEEEWDNDHDGDAGDGSETHYETYQIPSPPRRAENSYREAFVTAEGQQHLTPPIDLKRATLERRYAAATQARIDAEQRYQAALGTSAAVYPHLARDDFDKARAEEGIARDLLNGLNREPTSWQDGHQPYDNVKDPIARIRFATHTGIVPFEGAEAEANTAAIAQAEVDLAQAAHEMRVLEEAENEREIDGTATVESHQEMRIQRNTLRSRRANAEATLDELRAGGRSVKVFFIEEIQPPQPDQQEKMTPIYRKHWREIAFKWALNYAAEHDHDVVAWTTGQQQVDRYPSIAQLVHSIAWEPLLRSGPDPLRVVTIDVKDRGQIKLLVNAKTGKLESAEGPSVSEDWVGRHLGQVISAEHAKTVLAGETGKLEGDNLEVGGQGLRQTYDVDFVNVVNNLPALQRFRERKVIQRAGKRPKVKLTGSLVGSFNIGAQPATFHVEQSTDRVLDTRIIVEDADGGATRAYAGGEQMPVAQFETLVEAETWIRERDATGLYVPGQYRVRPPGRARAPILVWRDPGPNDPDVLLGTFDTETDAHVFVDEQPLEDQSRIYKTGGNALAQPMRSVTTYSVVRRSDRARTTIATFMTAEEAAAELTRRQASYGTPVLQPGIELTPELKQAVKSTSLFQEEDRQKNLIVQHNVTAENLRHAARLGGIPVPSLAIAKVDDSLTGFGEITLIGKKEMADPKGYAKPKVFGADIYSPRYPRIEYAPDRATLARLNAILAPYRTAKEREIYGAEISSPDDLAQRAEFLAYHKATAPATPDHFMTQRAAAAALLRQVGATERIFQGFTDLGNRRYKPHTLDNVVAILKKDLRGGESDNNIYGIGQLRSKFTPQFRSVKQIVEAEDRIISDEAFEAVKKETDTEFWAIVAELQPYTTRDVGFGFADTVMAVMADAATKGIPFALKEYNDFGDVPLEIQQRIAGFMRNLRTMPTEYFEAKILREVDLAEFAGAVVHEDTPADVLELLRSRGVQIVTYPKEGSGASSAGRKAAVAAFAKSLGDKVLFQQEPPTKKRGSITAADADWVFGFGPLRAFTLQMFEGADVTTFTHESAHLFLQIMGDLAGRPEATARIKRDWATINAWLFSGQPGGVGPIGRREHEKFANAFNLYLSEGKAPSLKLRAVFEKFRAWFLRFTEELIRHDVKLTDPVRRVFDRMLASDAAIAEAKAASQATPMFTTPESAGMSLAEFDVYQAKIAEAGLAERQKLERQLLRDLQKQQRADYREQKAAIREQVEGEVYAMPVYRALAAIRHGTQPDGSPITEGVPAEPLRLSSEIIAARYPDRLAKLPATPTPVHVSGGLDPDTVAELFGFTSGDALLVAITKAPSMRGLITSATNTRMQAAVGDLLVDDRLSDLAKEAVANEHREAIVRIEMQTLARLKRAAQAGATKERDYERRWFEAEAKLRIAIAEGHKQVEVETARGIGKERLAALRATSRQKIDALDAEVKTLKALARSGAARINATLPTEAELRTLAHDRIAQTRIKDLKPAVFQAASRRAGQAASDAAARQDFDAAITAKQQEAISLALYREATRVLKDVDARVKAAAVLDTPASRKRMGLAGASYQRRIDDILDRYEFAPLGGRALAKRVQLRAWVAELQQDGMAAELPEAMLDDARRIHYRELTVVDLVEVSDTLATIVHLARVKNRLLKNKDARDFAIERDKLVDSIRTHGTTNKLPPVAFRTKDERRRSIKEWFASHARIATLAQVMDGPGDGGAMHSAIIRPLNDAASAQETRFVTEGQAYAAILERHYPGALLGQMHELLEIPAIGQSLTLDERLAVAKNWGNETSRDRMTSDPHRKWNARQIQAILDTLSANDLAYVQATFDFVNKFWPEIAAKTKRLTGIEPEKVEAVPITARAGTIPGGYYPLAADSRFNARTRQWEKATEAQLSTSAAYVSQTTRRGHLETRVKHAEYTVKLDGGVLFAHLEQVIHDLTHHETLIDVTRLLRDPKVAAAIFETQGDVVYEQFTSALEAIAEGKLKPAENWMDKSATFMRSRTQVALLGWNLWTAVQQPLGIFNGMERVGVRWVARGLGRWLADTATFESTVAWIHSVSPTMQGRHRTGTADIMDVRESLKTAGGWFDTLVRTVTANRATQQQILDSYLWTIGLMQRVADVPTWLGQYEKSLAAGETEARAIALADQAVIDSQGSGRISDLSTIQRGRPVARMFLMFYAYGSATYNATYRRAGQTNFKSPAQVAKFIGGLSLIYIFPSMGTVALAQLVGRGGGGDDDDWLARYFSDVGRESVSAALNGMFLVRELAAAGSDALVVLAGGVPKAGGVRGYAGPAGARPVQLMTQLLGQAKQLEPDEAFWKALNAGAGAVFRYPASQVQRTVEGWLALQEGETSNPAALLFGPPRE